MPEGDTIYGAAGRIRGALVGQGDRVHRDAPPAVRARPLARAARAAARCARWTRTGKHLFIRFEGDLTLHSHLRMNGWWGVYRRGQRWGKSPSRAWLVIRTRRPRGGAVRRPGARADDRLALALRPADRAARPGHPRRGLRRARPSCAACARTTRAAASATRCSTSATCAGIGNLWKSEACFLAGLDPVAAAGRGERRRGARRGQRRPAADAPLRRGRRARARARGCSSAHGRPCRRCGTTIRARGQGDDNRTTYWCPACQA